MIDLRKSELGLWTEMKRLGIRTMSWRYEASHEKQISLASMSWNYESGRSEFRFYELVAIDVDEERGSERESLWDYLVNNDGPIIQHAQALLDRSLHSTYDTSELYNCSSCGSVTYNLEALSVRIVHEYFKCSESEYSSTLSPGEKLALLVEPGT